MIDYFPNDEAAAIAGSLIPEFHPHLIGLNIAHLSKVRPPKKKKQTKQPRLGKKITMAKTARVPEKMRVLGADFMFVIEYDDEIWRELSEESRRALVDHELAHCGNDADGVYLKHHGLEEFGEVVRRWGTWHSDILRFADELDPKYHEAQEQKMQKMS